jgi:DNA-binding CsgD family transcriptional regulator
LFDADEYDLPEVVIVASDVAGLAALSLARSCREVVGWAPDGSVELGDDDLVLLLCRRPILEGLLRWVVESAPGARVRAGRVVGGLLARPTGWLGVPLVEGVRTAGGQDIPACGAAHDSQAWPEAPAPRAPALARQPALTPRQWDVTALVARGLSNRQIAEALTIMERTAENHVEHILAKLGFHSRVQIAAWAIAERAAPGGVPRSG